MFQRTRYCVCVCVCARTTTTTTTYISERFPFCPFKWTHADSFPPIASPPPYQKGYKDTIYIYIIISWHIHTPHAHTSRRLCPYARSDPRSTVQRFVVKSIFGRGEELYSSVYHAMSVAFTNVTFPILSHLTQEITHAIHNKYLFINIYFF